MQVAEGDVADAGAEQAGGQGLGVADNQAALGVFGHRTAGHVGVADGDQGLARLASSLGGSDQPFVHLADTAQVVVAQVRTGDFGRAQEGQRQAPGAEGAVGPWQRNEQAFGV